MKKEEFEKLYCEQSGITLSLYKNKLITLSCKCGDELCLGWVALSKDSKLDIENHKRLYM